VPLTPLLSDNEPPLTLHTAFSQWEFAPVVTAGLIVAALLYAVGVWRVRRDHPARPWPLLRTASFATGLATIAIATQSSIGAYDDVLFWIHMWQHLLLLMVAPVFLLLGQPITLLLHASRNPLHTWTKQLVRSRVLSALTFPPVGVLLYIGCVVGTHLTGFMNLTLEHPVVHDLEHVLYLVVGYLYFLPLIGKEPIRWRLSFTGQLFLLVLAMPVDTFTGVVLLQTNHELFPAYAGRRSWGPGLVDDLHAGGASMWIGGDAIMFVIIIATFITVLHSRRTLDAGKWLESARDSRFSSLTGAAVASSPGSTDEDDDKLTAYNDYLARLNAGPPTSEEKP
jgi:cytochrome c oxidase assembly factor CtaG